MSFLNLEGKTFLLLGVANKRSIAWQAARLLREEGARCLYSVRDERTRKKTHAILGIPLEDLCLCDVEHQDQVEALAAWVREKTDVLHGLLHSIAFANFADGVKPFHETVKADFMQALDISAFSLVNLANALKDLFDPDAAVVTMSISDPHMAAENYGYMAPIKACLDSSVAFLAKSFSRFSRVRFNAVAAGPMWTLAAAGIPGYMDNFLYAEHATLRHENLKTVEAANLAVFLLSERASGINAQRLVVDAGMGVNYFDAEIVKKVMAKDQRGAAPAGSRE